ncbi:LppU/SCO3897 family protein [Nocardia sp. NPDC003963]
MTEPAPDEDGGRAPLSQQDKRARVGATAAAIAIAAVVTSIVLGIGVAALLATAGSDEKTDDLAAPPAVETTASPGVATTSPAPVAPPSVLVPTSTPPAPPSVTASAVGTAGSANKEAKQAPPKVEVAAGECLSAVGEKDVVKASCGSAESRYKVASTGPAGTACPADADSSHTIGETTMCLDIDWVVGSCVDVSSDQPQRTECGPGGVQVISILPETVDVNACPSADRGFVYDERRFVVCIGDR